MIYVDFNGRCGDQFFQYAFARKIQLYLRNKEPLNFNFYNQERWRKKTNNDSFRNDLQFFHVVENNSFVSEINNFEKYGSKHQKELVKKYDFWRKVSVKLKVRFFARSYQKKLQRNGLYFDDEYFDFFKYPKTNIDVFIRGYFEDYKNFYEGSLRDAILQELKPKQELRPEYLEFLNKIKNCNSVCISLRSWKEVKDDSSTFNSRMICSKQYYEEAIKIIKEKFSDAVLFIFSDDIEWAKQTLGSIDNVYFESGDNTIEEKIILMSACKHFVIANSSFSWWVQYLSTNINKTIISPDRWYNDNNDTRIIHRNWIIIKTF